MHRWSRLARTLVLSDRWLRVFADRCEAAPGKIIEPYYVINDKDWVHIYAQNAQGALLTVRQYRYAADVICTELPGGVVDDGEDPEQAARRELLEETGHAAHRWSYIARLHANPARQTNAVHVFVAQELEMVTEPHLDEFEELEWSFHTPEELREAIVRGEFSQALHGASFYRVEQFLRERSDA